MALLVVRVRAAAMLDYRREEGGGEGGNAGFGVCCSVFFSLRALLSVVLAFALLASLLVTVL